MPDVITVGKITCNTTRLSPLVEDFGIFAYKFDEAWENASVFSRLVGYAPHTQRDAEKEINKVLENRIESFSNVPTDGFSLVMPVARLYNAYKQTQSKYFKYGICIKDPRGFIIAISDSDFSYLLDSTNGNLVDGHIPGKFVYVWQKNSVMPQLMSENDPRYISVVKSSSEHSGKIANKITDKNIITGHVYRSSKVIAPGDYLYVGRHDTYSENCHISALIAKQYDVAHWCANDVAKFKSKNLYSHIPTTQNKLVFVRLKKNKNTNSFELDLTDFVVRTSCNSLFLTDVSDTIDRDELKSLNDLANETLEHSLMFNKIDFASMREVPMSEEFFRSAIINSNEITTKLYPYAYCSCVRDMNSYNYYKSLSDTSFCSVFVQNKYKYCQSFTYNENDLCEFIADNDVEWNVITKTCTGINRAVTRTGNTKICSSHCLFLDGKYVVMTAKTESGHEICDAHKYILAMFWIEARRQSKK